MCRNFEADILWKLQATAASCTFFYCILPRLLLNSFFFSFLNFHLSVTLFYPKHHILKKHVFEIYYYFYASTQVEKINSFLFSFIMSFSLATSNTVQSATVIAIADYRASFLCLTWATQLSDANVLCYKTAVLGDTIKETPCRWTSNFALSFTLSWVYRKGQLT